MLFDTQGIIAAVGESYLEGAKERREYEKVSTDTREDCTGALFIALSGERFDGNAFLPQASRAGAPGAVIGPGAPKELPQGFQCFRVPNTLRALQSLGAAHRKKHFSGRAVAVTGSNGKSTTKQMIASVSSLRYKTHATEGNRNNHIGVPLTLLGLDPSAEILVAEIGANHPGEIRTLAGLISPEISVITNISPCHLEGFGSLEGVLEAKTELFEATAADGLCIFNGDDPLLSAAAPRFGRRTMSFGLGGDNEVRAVKTFLDESVFPSFELDSGLRVRLPIPGEHNIYNALAAAAAGRALGLTGEEIREGLESTKPMKMRMNLFTAGGVRVLDDSYNANPVSIVAALGTLDSIRHSGPRVAVIGEMLELGREAERLHREVAGKLAAHKLDLAVMVGSHARSMREAYIQAGGRPDSVLTASDAGSCWDLLKSRLAGGELVLIKGSRGIGLDYVARQLEKNRP